jgi:hypothetical protein
VWQGSREEGKKEVRQGRNGGERKKEMTGERKGEREGKGGGQRRKERKKGKML